MFQDLHWMLKLQIVPNPIDTVVSCTLSMRKCNLQIRNSKRLTLITIIKWNNCYCNKIYVWSLSKCNVFNFWEYIVICTRCHILLYALQYCHTVLGLICSSLLLPWCFLSTYEYRSCWVSSSREAWFHHFFWMVSCFLHQLQLCSKCSSNPTGFFLFFLKHLLLWPSLPQQLVMCGSSRSHNVPTSPNLRAH